MGAAGGSDVGVGALAGVQCPIAACSGGQFGSLAVAGWAGAL
jgi:hypothetical protein